MSTIKTILKSSICVAVSIAFVLAVYYLLNGIKLIRYYEHDHTMFNNVTFGYIYPQYKWIECTNNDTQCVGVIASDVSFGFFCYSAVNSSNKNMSAYQVSLQCMKNINTENDTKCYSYDKSCYDEKYVMFVKKMYKHGLIHIILASIFIVCAIFCIIIFVVQKAIIPKKSNIIDINNPTVNSSLMSEKYYSMYD